MTDAVGLAWQGSLLAIGEASVDRTFASLHRHELDGGAWVEHVPGWLAGADDASCCRPGAVVAAVPSSSGVMTFWSWAAPASGPWGHTIPKVARAGPRISLAFRHGV